MNLIAVFSNISNITFIVLLAVVLSFFLPGAGSVFQPYVTYLVMVILYLSFIKTPNAIRLTGQLKNITFGLILQYLIVGTAGLIIAKTFLSNPELIAGLILISITPTGITNVVFTDAIHGRTDIAIAIIIAGTIIAPFIVPLWALLFIGAYIPIDALDLFVNITTMILVPLTIAKITKTYGKNLTEKIIKKSNYVQIIALFIIIFALISPAVKYLIDPANVTINVIVFLVVGGVMLTGIIAGYLTRFLRADMDLTKTFMVIGARKNTALCFGLISFLPPAAVLPLIAWSILHNIWIGILQLNRFNRLKEENMK